MNPLALNFWPFVYRKAKWHRLRAKIDLMREAIEYVKSEDKRVEGFSLDEYDSIEERIISDLKKKFGLEAEIEVDYDEDKEIHFVVISLDTELVKALRARRVRVKREINDSSLNDENSEIDDSRWPSHLKE
jgi:hypothetical protein